MSLYSLSTFGNIARVYGSPHKENQSSHTSFQKVKKSLLKYAQIPKIRVLIEKAKKTVVIHGTDLKRKLHFSKSTKTFRGRKAVKFNCGDLKGKISTRRPLLLASLASPTGLISFGKEKFSGLMHVISSAKGDSCDVINEINIENYISSLLAREMNAKWPLEALKAQAVAARSYAIHKMNTGQVKKIAGFETYYHIESSEKHQVSGNLFDTNPKTNQASRETSGYILTNKKGEISPIFFHAQCGGKTLVPQEVWANTVSGYQSVKCSFCHDHDEKEFHKSISLQRWNNFTKWLIRKDFLPKELESSIHKNFALVTDKMFNRDISFYSMNKKYTFKKSLLRRYFGRFIVPSNNFTLSIEKGSHKNEKMMQVKGSGLGHGVGMCQLGALDMAKKGMDYKQILTHYFPNHRLEKIY